MNFKFLAIIPARKNSKRIKNKNFKLLNGKPLIWYTIKEAKKVKKIDKIIVSSDDKKILTFAKKQKVDSVLRPVNISLSTTQQENVIDHIINHFQEKNMNFKYVILLQPTSPLRKSIDIIRCMNLIKNKNVNSVISVYKKKLFTWKKIKKNYLPDNYNPLKRTRSQKLKPFIVENGAIYVFKLDKYKKQKLKSRVIKKYALYSMPEIRSVDIDDMEDFKLASRILK